MMSKLLIAALFIMLSPLALAKPLGQPYMKCGGFTFSTSENDDGWARINGAKPDSQKLTFLKAQGDYENVMMQWMLPRSDAPGWLGLDYVKRGKKAILNVEVIRNNMDEPRQFWTYDCRKIK